MFNTILVLPLFNLLALIYAVIPGHDFGVAVILLTILVRLALWPLVNKQLHSQKAMAELAPEIAKVKAKAKGDKQLEGKLLMELYKTKEISPFASLLPLLVQLPLFLALFVVLRDVIKPGEIAHLAYGPVKNLAFIKTVIASGSFKPTLAGGLNLAVPSAVLAVVAGLAQFYQTKQLTPKKSAGQKAMPGMAGAVYIFPALTVLVALKLPAALALYWTVTSLVAIVQQHLVLNRDVEEMEAKN